MSPDRMTETLTALRADVDRVGLADSASIRHRGQQRSRNQAIGGTLAALCLVAAGVGVAGGLTGDNSAEAPPAKDGTATTTQQAEQTYALSNDPFITTDDWTNFGEYQGIGTLVDPLDQPRVPEAPECTFRPDTLAAAEVHGARYFQGDPQDPALGNLSEAEIAEYVLRFDTAADAEAAAAQVRYTVGGGKECGEVDPDEGTLTTTAPEPVAGLDHASRTSRYFVPAFASEPSYSELAVARTGNVLVVLTWHGFDSTKADGAWTVPAETLAAALDRAIEGGQR